MRELLCRVPFSLVILPLRPPVKHVEWCLRYWRGLERGACNRPLRSIDGVWLSAHSCSQVPGLTCSKHWLAVVGHLLAAGAPTGAPICIYSGWAGSGHTLPFCQELPSLTVPSTHALALLAAR